MTDKIQYWNNLIERWQGACPQRLWRIHSDAVNIALLSRWMKDTRVKHLLKTDMFDEAISEGLYPFLASRSKSVIGMDLSVSTLHAARARYIDMQAAAADARCLPFADDTFDVIVSNSTIDHYESPDEIVKSLYELRRVLRSNGQLLLTLDNLANPLIILRNLLPFRLLNRLGIVPYYVGATFGPYRLRQILQQVGFEVLEVRAVMHCPRVLAVMAAHIIERYASLDMERRYLSFLSAFEYLSYWPTRFLTGHFISAKVIKI